MISSLTFWYTIVIQRWNKMLHLVFRKMVKKVLGVWQSEYWIRRVPIPPPHEAQVSHHVLLSQFSKPFPHFHISLPWAAFHSVRARTTLTVTSTPFSDSANKRSGMNSLSKTCGRDYREAHVFAFSHSFSPSTTSKTTSFLSLSLSLTLSSSNLATRLQIMPE